MNGWDGFMDALGAPPEWQQYRNKLRVADMVKTAEQLAKYGVPYPHDNPDRMSRYEEMA